MTASVSAGAPAGTEVGDMDMTDKDGVAGICGVPRLAWLAPPQPVTNEEAESPKMAKSETKRAKRIMSAHNYSHELMVDYDDEAEITATNS
jgi:hypothetical protein